MNKWHLLVKGKKQIKEAMDKNVSVCVCVFDLVTGGLQNSVGAFRGHALDDSGPQPLSDEADVRQQLGELPLETGDLLKKPPKQQEESFTTLDFNLLLAMYV